MDARRTEEAERFDIVANGAARGGVGFHEKRKACAARHRFQAQRAGAGKKIEHTPALRPGRPLRMRQHVEHGLAGAVAGRAGIAARRARRWRGL
jgi:hypothetical protein